MISASAPEDRVIARCTLGYAWALAMRVHRDGWTGDARLLCEQLTSRIALWHEGGISGAWS